MREHQAIPLDSYDLILFIFFQNSSGLADLLGEQSSELHETPLLDIGAAEPVKPVPRVTSSPNLAHKGFYGLNFIGTVHDFGHFISENSIGD